MFPARALFQFTGKPGDDFPNFLFLGRNGFSHMEKTRLWLGAGTG